MQQQQQQVFVADDKFSEVIVALEGRGWHRSGHVNSPNFQLKWRNLSNINFRLLRSDQFVNHIYNSQQLSNKALLAGHLAYRHHDHHHRQHRLQVLGQCSDGRGGPSNGCGHDDHSHSSGDPGGAPAAAPAAESHVRLKAVSETEITNPEAFFPRCWDVSDGGDGVCSMLKSFAVSAAVALLRAAVKAEEENQPNRNRRKNGVRGGGGGTGKRGASAANAPALAAATSIASRYVSTLRSSAGAAMWKSPPGKARGVASDAGPSGTVSGKRAHTGGLTCCGRDAADAAVTLESPELMSVLTAWEASGATRGTAARDGEAGRSGLAAEEPRHPAGPGLAEFTSATDGLVAPEAPMDGVFGCGKGESHPNHSSEKQRAEDGNDGEEEEEGRRNEGGMAGSLARAKEILRALDEEADPQGVPCLGEANAWVVKPAGLSCGRGVEVTSSLRGLVSACRRLDWKAVVQKYVERPLLVQGYKFDIRQWVLLTSCNPLVVWGFDESYVRFSSRPFTMDAASLSDRLVHLCNHSVQKEQNQGVGPRQSPGGNCKKGAAAAAGRGGGGGGGGGDNCNEGSGARGGRERVLPSGSRGNMWTADQLRGHLQERFQGDDVFREMVLPRIRSVVVETLLGVREGLEMKGRALEWLGFDLMVTEDLRVMLIEVNVSPDVSHSTPVTARLVPAATKDALGLLLDEGKANARATTAATLPKLPQLMVSPPGSSEVATGVKPTSPSGPGAVEARGPARAGLRGAGPEPPVSEACAEGGVQEGEPDLRWRLWHKGEEEESRNTLSRLRGEKKAWFEARRNNRRKSVGGPVENDRGRALSVVERVVGSAAAAVASASGCSTSVGRAAVFPSSGPPQPPAGPLGCPLAFDGAVSPWASRPEAHAGSPPEGCSGSRGKGTVNELRGATAGLSMPRPGALAVTQDEEEESEL